MISKFRKIPANKPSKALALIALLLTLLLSTLIFFPNPPLLAQDHPIEETPFDRAKRRFSKDNINRVFEKAKESIDAVKKQETQDEVKTKSGNRVDMMFEKGADGKKTIKPPKDLRFSHPWEEANPTAMEDWEADSERILGEEFWSCVQPGIREIGCEYCQPAVVGFIDDSCSTAMPNFGWVMEYWWPEFIIEVNQFGISAINGIGEEYGFPAEYARPTLIRNAWDHIVSGHETGTYQAYLRSLGMPETDLEIAYNYPGNLLSRPDEDERTRAAPYEGTEYGKGLEAFAGRLGAMADLNASNQNQNSEAHIYSTKIEVDAPAARTYGEGLEGKLYLGYSQYCLEFDFWYNGWMFGNAGGCFMDTLDPKDMVYQWDKFDDKKFGSADAEGNAGGEARINRLKENVKHFAVKRFTEDPEDNPFEFDENAACIATEDREGIKEDLDSYKTFNEGGEGSVFNGKGKPYFNLWRLPQNSGSLCQPLYESTRPFAAGEELIQNSDKLRQGASEEEGGPQWWQKDTCSAYRQFYWPEKFEDLEKIFQMLPAEEETVKKGSVLESNCYQETGLHLYPLIGETRNVQDPYSHAALVARRGLELITNTANYNGMQASRRKFEDGEECYWKTFDWDSVQRFTEFNPFGEDIDHTNKDLDKIQMIYPEVSKCFEIQDIELLQKDFFTKKGENIDDNGSIRFVYWNKREACVCEMRGAESAHEFDNGEDDYTSEIIKFVTGVENFGWGCQSYPKDDLDHARGDIHVNNTISKGSAGAPMECVYPFGSGGVTTSLGKLSCLSAEEGMKQLNGTDCETGHPCDNAGELCEECSGDAYQCSGDSEDSGSSGGSSGADGGGGAGSSGGSGGNSGSSGGSGDSGGSSGIGSGAGSDPGQSGSSNSSTDTSNSNEGSSDSDSSEDSSFTFGREESDSTGDSSEESSAEAAEDPDSSEGEGSSDGNVAEESTIKLAEDTYSGVNGDTSVEEFIENATAAGEEAEETVKNWVDGISSNLANDDRRDTINSGLETLGNVETTDPSTISDPEASAAAENLNQQVAASQAAIENSLAELNERASQLESAIDNMNSVIKEAEDHVRHEKLIEAGEQLKNARNNYEAAVDNAQQTTISSLQSVQTAQDNANNTSGEAESASNTGSGDSSDSSSESQSSNEDGK